MAWEGAILFVFYCVKKCRQQQELIFALSRSNTMSDVSRGVSSTSSPSMPSPSLSPYINAFLSQHDCVSDDDERPSKKRVIYDSDDDVRAPTPSASAEFLWAVRCECAAQASRSKKRKVLDDSDDDEFSQPQPQVIDLTSDADHDDDYLGDYSDDDSTIPPQSPPPTLVDDCLGLKLGVGGVDVAGLTSLGEPEIAAWDNDIRKNFCNVLTKLLDANILPRIVKDKRTSCNLDGADDEVPPVESVDSQHSDDEIDNQQGLESDSPELFPFELTVKAASKDHKLYFFNRPKQYSVVRVHDKLQYKIDIDPDETVVDGITQITAYGRCLEDPSKSSRDYQSPDGSAQIDHVNRGALQAMSLLNDYKSLHSDAVSDKDKAIFRSVVELLKQTDMVKPFTDYACFANRFEF